jgi:hypothetical protein
LSNALTAAVTAICCTALSTSLVLAGLEYVNLYRQNPISLMISLLLVFLATLFASVVIFARIIRWKRVQFEFRSPLVINLADSTNPRQAQIQSAVARVLAPRPALAIHEGLATNQTPCRSWVVETRALAWQTMKEGRRTWRQLVLIALVLPALIYVLADSLDPSWLLLMSGCVTIMAGTSVFGLENRARTHRFLTHHGVRPGLVWAVKLAI